MSQRRRPSAAEQARLQAELVARHKRERQLLALAAIGLVVLLVAGGVGLQAWRTSRPPTAVPAVADPAETPVPILPGQPLRFGRPGAPVRVALYEDFHCPHCADFEEEFGPILLQARQRGTAVLEFYPMSFIDEGSGRAANAMACAAEAGFGVAYYRGLFANHTRAWSDDQIVTLAAKINGSVPERFRTCVTGRAHAGWVDSINAAADRAGVTSTPSLFVNGEPVDLTKTTPAGLQARIDDLARA